jgi:ABC-type transporter lipoprotein component MlaA
MIPIKFVHNKKVWNLEDSHDQVVSQPLCVTYMQHVNYGDKQQNH